MWLAIWVSLVVMVSPVAGWCVTLPVTIDPSTLGVSYQGPAGVAFEVPGLDGTVLSGQSLSLDVMLPASILGRLSLSDPTALGVGLGILTNANTFPGFAGPTTGFLLDASGNPFGSTQEAGRADGDNGAVIVGLVSFTQADLGDRHGVEIRGVHFDTSLPNTGFLVTNTVLGFWVNSPYDRLEFGTAAQLPEPPSLWFALAGIFPSAVQAWRRTG